MTLFIQTLKRNLSLGFIERQLFSFFLALAGLIYELSFAQILSATLGNTSLRFATTIGLFTLTLGLSSLAYERFKIALPILQAGLFIVGILGPTLILWADPKNFPEGWYWFSLIVSHLPIVATGLLSGFELPLILDDTSTDRKSFILAWDYFGMFLGTLLFPLYLLPTLGVTQTIYYCASLNALMFAYLVLRPKREKA